MTLLNFDSQPTRASLLVAGVFTLLCLLSLCYSLGIYLYRSRAIRSRKAARYHDEWGPSVLCVALLAAVMLNFGFEGRERGIW